MEKRLLVAVVLMTAAIMFTNLLFPPPEAPPVADEAEISAAPDVQAVPGATLPRAVTPTAGGPATPIVVESDAYRFVFTSRGAGLTRAELLEYSSYTQPGQTVQLIPEEAGAILGHRLVVGGDTVDLRTLVFEPSAPSLRVGEEADTRELSFTYADPEGFGVVIQYSFDPVGYLVSARGRVDGLGGRAGVLLTDVGRGLELHEHPDHHSDRETALVTRTPSGSVDRTPFRRLDGTRFVDAPLTWTGIKDKYFLAALIAGDESPLPGAIVRDVPDVTRTVDGDDLVLPRAEVTAIVPVAADGSFRFDMYLGPQDYGRLSAIGYDLQEVTPYGYRWLQPIIRPLAAAVLWVLNALHDTLGIAYGWVLVIFGVMMRIVLWPLNAKAMRAQMKNMGVQPLLQEIREKYANDPQKQQQAMMALYKEHGFNPFAGCLPMLVPFPVLITLFFVFQNTIAFRGAEFLWLPDLSLRDPFYILPFVLVVSMFALQWVSAHLSGIEQNPQMKMMMYFMPIMMGVIFFMLPAGLNLYYAVTQVASIPQQVLIARERRVVQDELKKSGGPKLSSPPTSGKAKKSKAKR